MDNKLEEAKEKLKQIDHLLKHLRTDLLVSIEKFIYELDE